MQNLISKVTMNWKLATGLAVLAVFVLFGAPRAYDSITKASGTVCANAPQSPTLNPYPVTVSNQPCHDWPAFWAGKNGQYPSQVNQYDWNANEGDIFEMRAYIHNGEPEGSPEPARGIAAVITVNNQPGAHHVVGSTVTSSNAGSVLGSFSIFTDANEKLEIVSGSAHIEDWYGRTDSGAGSVYIGQSGGEPAVLANLNDMPGCFEQSKFIVFQVRVVRHVTEAPAPVQQDYSINAELGSQVSGQCLYNGIVDWQTQNVNDVIVTVSDPNLEASNYDNETVFARMPSGHEMVNWIEPQKPYRFSLWERNPSQGGENRSFRIYGGATESHFVKRLTEDWIPSGAALNCGPVTPPAPESFNFSVSSTDFCAVTEVASVQITGATPGLYGKAIYWSSTFQQIPTGENNAFYNHYVSSNGSFSQPMGVFRQDQVGAWTKTATIDGVSRTVSFYVRNCATQTPPPPAQLVCAPGSQNADVQDTVFFNATGGTGIYSWSAAGSIESYPQGNNFHARYLTAGQKVVTVTSGNQSANCLVNVISQQTPPPPSQLICTASATSVQTGQSVTFTAQGGEGNYSWTQNGSPVGNNSATYSTTFNLAGTYNVRVSRGNQSANCPAVVVEAPVVVPQLICTASATNIQTGSSVMFTANGGQGTFSWTQNGSLVGNNSATYSATFNLAGTYNVRVSRGNQSANCPAVVVEAPVVVPQLVCEVSSTSVQTGQSVIFTANGGQGSFYWTQNGSPVGSNSATYSTTFNLAGTYNVRVTRGNQSANCPAVVVTAPVAPSQLVCLASTTNIQTGESISFTAQGGEGNYSWTQNGSPVGSNSASYATTFNLAGTYNVRVSRGSQTANCPTVVVTAPVVVPQLICLASATNVQTGVSVNFTAQGGEGAYSWSVNSSSVGNNSSVYSASFATPGTYNVRVTRGGQTANCPAVVASAPQIPQLICTASATSVQTGQSVTFTAQGGEGSYSWLRNGSSVGSNSANYVSSFTQAGTYNVRVLRGSQFADCPVVTVTTPVVVCVPNTNGILTVGTIGELANGKFSTTISYSFSGNNAVRVVYINPDNGQEVSFVTSANSSGSQLFANFDANKDYVFKLYDTASCGGLMDTVIVRKNVSTQCIPNTNFALNASNVVKTGSTYSVTLAWSSTGTHGIKITQNSTGNVITTGTNSGSFTVTGLQAGSSHSFFMVDATCNVTLSSVVVNIPQEPVVVPPVTSGNCNNSTNSCNTNTISNNVTGNNNNNVGNNTNINGNNNTVTNTNTCVNNSCNNTITYFINNQGSTVPQNELRQISIVKSVRLTSGSFQNSVNANQNDTVEFQLVVTNTGNQVVNNVRVQDQLPAGLTYAANNTFQNDYFVGSLLAGESRTLVFQARVTATSNTSIQNIARASGDSVSQVQDDAWVFVSGSVAGGNVSMNFSKKAWNDTKNVDAQSTPAAREDFITYTLTVTNSGNAPATGFVVTDDLSQVLPYADIVDNGGGTLSGNVITYPAVTIPSGSSITKSFKVRVKFYLAQNLSYVMNNTYGNTVTIRINTPQVLGTFTAPKTGSDAGMAGLFASLLTGAFAAFKKRKALMSLILAE